MQESMSGTSQQEIHAVSYIVIGQLLLYSFYYTKVDWLIVKRRGLHQKMCLLRVNINVYDSAFDQLTKNRRGLHKRDLSFSNSQCIQKMFLSFLQICFILQQYLHSLYDRSMIQANLKRTTYFKDPSICLEATMPQPQ